MKKKTDRTASKVLLVLSIIFLVIYAVSPFVPAAHRRHRGRGDGFAVPTDYGDWSQSGLWFAVLAVLLFATMATWAIEEYIQEQRKEHLMTALFMFSWLVVMATVGWTRYWGGRDATELEGIVYYIARLFAGVVTIAFVIDIGNHRGREE